MVLGFGKQGQDVEQELDVARDWESGIKGEGVAK